MLPVNFPQSNKVYAKPEGWTDEECSDLNVWQGDAPIEGTNRTVPAIISCWRLSHEDLQEIQRTGIVWLSITGTAMPPVSVFTECPFEQE